MQHPHKLYSWLRENHFELPLLAPCSPDSVRMLVTLTALSVFIMRLSLPVALSVAAQTQHSSISNAATYQTSLGEFHIQNDGGAIYAWLRHCT